jgi:predicted secreted hydrolase
MITRIYSHPRLRNIALAAMLVLLIGTAITLIWYVVREQEPIVSLPSIATGFGTANTPALDGFQRATAPRQFTFPADHGPHSEYQTEWWYYTGNLQSADAREWGYQLTFFRRALSPSPSKRESHWATNNIYFAHFALTDVSGQQFFAADRINRGSDLGLAGASGDPYRVFVENWSAQGTGETATLRAADDRVAIELHVQSLKPPMLQGENSDGFSPKGTTPGNASYYYSLPRMATDGTITLDGRTYTVNGLSWMDHEWGTWAFDEGQVGWDWFGLQLDDGRDLMWGQLRRDDGSLDVAYGSISNSDGTTTPLHRTDLSITAIDTWTSPQTGVQYPSRWRVELLKENLTLEVVPRIADQELLLGRFTYWEGSVLVEGSVHGQGYVELTGYGIGGQSPR